MLKFTVEILGDSVLYSYSIGGQILSQRYFGRDESSDAIAKDLFDEIKLRGKDILPDLRKAIKIDDLIRNSIKSTIWENFYAEETNKTTALSQKPLRRGINNG